MRRAAKSPVIDVPIIHYPESDGRRMGETDRHRDAIVRHIQMLQYHFRGQQVYVSGDLLFYYEQGNPKKFVVPDTFVVKGVEPGERRTYKLWVERKIPNVVLETTSRKTKRKDLVVKPVLYAQLQIPEYFLFDPTQEYLDPPLKGFRLVAGKYEPIEPDAQGGLISEELGMRLVVEGGYLAFYRLDTGERLLTDDQRAAKEAERAEIEAERAAKEAAARTVAEAETARLREQLRQRDEA